MKQLCLLSCTAALLLSACASMPTQLERQLPGPLERDWPFVYEQWGNHEFESIVYAGETNPRRREFDSVHQQWRSEGVSLDGYWQPEEAEFWGFDEHRVPLNGRLWIPQGPGPFPLVLIAHGNSDYSLRSYEGYGYLGEFLASHGFVVASMDHSYLNGQSYENDARGVLILHHGEQLIRWSDTSGHPLEGLIDSEAIGVVGHSRGGSAALLAARMAQLDRFPGDSTTLMDWTIGIDAVVAIAPTEGQFRLAGKPTVPRGIDSLIIHGSYDGDVDVPGSLTNFYADFAPVSDGTQRYFAYLPRANHNQFNSVWAPSQDFRFPLSLDQIDAWEQQLAARSLISRFLLAQMAGESSLLEPLDQSTYDVQITRRGSSWTPVHDFADDDLPWTGPAMELFSFEAVDWTEEQLWMDRSFGFGWGSHWVDLYYARLSLQQLAGKDPGIERQGTFKLRFEQPRHFSALRFNLAYQPEDGNETPALSMAIRLVREDGTETEHQLESVVPLQEDPVILSQGRPHLIFQTQDLSLNGTMEVAEMILEFSGTPDYDLYIGPILAQETEHE